MARSRAQEESFDRNLRKASHYVNSDALHSYDGFDRGLRYYSQKINKSHRLFGIPHQFIAMNDPRLTENSNLGRCFAEKILLEAPVIAIQPGKPEFLPSLAEAKKENFFEAVVNSVTNDNILSQIFKDPSYKSEDDMVMYYQHKVAYQEMMSKVNILCRIMACFLGIQDLPFVVYDPDGNPYTTTYGKYDWRDYNIHSTYNDDTSKKQANQENKWWQFSEQFINSIKLDDEWVRFYVDANASYGESNSNTTKTSILESYTEKLEEMAKELEFVSGMGTGADIQALIDSTTTSIDQYIQSNAPDGAIGTMLKRLTGATRQILAGGNFLIPEIWAESKYSKNYSFSITLTTPYGCNEAWFLNIGVPLCHLLCLSLPNQISANVYKSPYLVKCFSPGWFNCNLGIVDSINIEKGSDQSWGIGGLPNEIKVTLSVTDLYASLGIPDALYPNRNTFLATGMLEFLAVNCGMDITNQSVLSKLTLWAELFTGALRDRFTKIDDVVVSSIKRSIRDYFSIFK